MPDAFDRLREFDAERAELALRCLEIGRRIERVRELAATHERSLLYGFNGVRTATEIREELGAIERHLADAIRQPLAKASALERYEGDLDQLLWLYAPLTAEERSRLAAESA